MRHGVPQAVLTLLFGLLLGWPGMATYVGFMLIGLCTNAVSVSSILNWPLGVHG